MEHPWIVGEGNPDVNLVDIPEKIKRFNAKTRLKKAGNAVLAMNRLGSLIGGIKGNKAFGAEKSGGGTGGVFN